MITPFPAVDEEPTNGIEVAGFRIVKSVFARGIDVTVITHGDQAGEEYRDGIRVIKVVFDDVKTLARRFRPGRAAVSGVLADLSPDLVHGQGMLFSALAAADYRGAPRVATAHGSPLWDALGMGVGAGSLVRGSVASLLALSAMRRLDAVISVHPDPRLHFRIEPRTFSYIPNIVASPPAGLPEREPLRVLYCGGTRWIKGWDRLRDAWPMIKELVPDAKLHVVGWPADLSPIGLPYSPEIEVEGTVTPLEVIKATARASVVVVPSRFEAAPIVMTDAWSVGTPVVGSTAGGIPGLATNAAVLVDAGSARELARAVVGCLERPVSVAALVAEGRRRAAAMNEQSVVDAHLRVYESVLAGEGRRGLRLRRRSTSPSTW